MTTIGQTLMDIEQLQHDIETHLSSGRVQPSKFIDDILNITKAYHFDLLAHSSLDTARAELSTTSNSLVLKYYALSTEAKVHEDYIRLINVGGLFMVWNIFERFIREIYGQIFEGLEIKHLKDAYKEILESKVIDRNTSLRMTGEFNVIRFVCNKLHQGTRYLMPKNRKLVLSGETYELEKGKPVKPIRLMTVINVLWRHYVTLT